MTAKRAYIKTYGCQMNVYDSRRMADVLAEGGYDLTEDPAAADLVLLNTCHIREKAAEKLYSDVGRFRQLKERAQEQGRSVLLGVAGCVAQAEGLEIIRRQPAVDLVFGPQTYHRLNDLVGEAESLLAHGRKPRVVDTEFPAEAKFDLLPRPGTQGVSAFLTIQEGCDKFCSFCVVPYTRGAEFSRPVADVMREAEDLVAKGAREITLLGQNVNAYHGVDGAGGEIGLGNLIRRLAGLRGLERIRYTTSHPRDLDDELIAAHRDVPQCMPYIHLPVQSGADSVLVRMNRQHTAAHYLKLIERLRTARPDIAISSDFIVGFPGETDAEFEATMNLVKDVEFAQAYSFKYSPRPGTPAADADEQVPEPVKAERLAVLQALLQSQQQAFNEATVGRTVEVLFDRPGQRPGQLAGRSPYMQAVHAEFGANANSAAAKGNLISVRVDAAGPNSLHGILVERSAA